MSKVSKPSSAAPYRTSDVITAEWFHTLELNPAAAIGRVVKRMLESAERAARCDARIITKFLITVEADSITEQAPHEQGACEWYTNTSNCRGTAPRMFMKLFEHSDARGRMQWLVEEWYMFEKVWHRGPVCLRVPQTLKLSEWQPKIENGQLVSKKEVENDEVS